MYYLFYSLRHMNTYHSYDTNNYLTRVGNCKGLI